MLELSPRRMLAPGLLALALALACAASGCRRSAPDAGTVAPSANAPAAPAPQSRVLLTRTQGLIDRSADPADGADALYVRLLDPAHAPDSAELDADRARWLAAWVPPHAAATVAAAWDAYRVTLPPPLDVLVAHPDGRTERFVSNPGEADAMAARLAVLDPSNLTRELATLHDEARTRAARLRATFDGTEDAATTGRRQAEADWLDLFARWLGGFAPAVAEGRTAAATQAAARAAWSAYARGPRQLLLARIEAATLDRRPVDADGRFRLSGEGALVLELERDGQRAFLPHRASDAVWFGLDPVTDRYEVAAAVAGEERMVRGTLPDVPPGTELLLLPPAALELVPQLLAAVRLHADATAAAESASAASADAASSGPATSSSVAAADRWTGIPPAQRRFLERRLDEIRQAVPDPYPLTRIGDRGRAVDILGGSRLATAWRERLAALNWDNLPASVAALEQAWREDQRTVTEGPLPAGGPIEVQADLAWLDDLRHVLAAARQLVRRYNLARLQADRRAQQAAQELAGTGVAPPPGVDPAAAWQAYLRDAHPRLAESLRAAATARTQLSTDGTYRLPHPGLLVIAGDPPWLLPATESR